MDENLRRSSTLLFSLALITLLAVGCSKPSAPSPESETSDKTLDKESSATETPAPEQEAVTPPGTTAAETSEEVTLRTATASEVRELIASKQGQVVLVDCWAIWCVPCLKQFPHTVEMHQQLQSKGLSVISLNFEDPTAAENAAVQDKVLSALKERNATFDNLIAKADSNTDVFKSFGVPDGIPYYMLYDRQGQLVHEFGGTQGKPVAEIDAAVEKLLAQ